MAHRYHDHNKAIQNFEQQVSLSIVIYMIPLQSTMDYNYGLCFINGGKAMLAPITRDPGSCVVIGNKLEYWFWELDSDLCHSCDIESIHVTGFALLLPLLCDPQRVGEVLPPQLLYNLKS